MSARFATVDIGADVSALPASERKALAKLVEASHLIDAIFLRQVWAGNEATLMRLEADQSPLGRARLNYFLLNKGGWSRIDLNKPFLPGVPEEKPGEGNFYPAGATKAEVEHWIAGLPADEHAKATGFFTTIRRAAPGSAQPFVLVPYSLEYQGELAPGRRAVARSRGAHDAADAQGLPDREGGRLPDERLLRERRRVDGARRVHRADDRPVRGLRGRVVQLQGRVRVVHHRAR